MLWKYHFQKYFSFFLVPLLRELLQFECHRTGDFCKLAHIRVSAAKFYHQSNLDRSILLIFIYIRVNRSVRIFKIRANSNPFQSLSLDIIEKNMKNFPKIYIKKVMFFFSKMTSAIIHNDTNISLLVTNNYYDDHMIAHTHVFMCNN